MKTFKLSIEKPCDAKLQEMQKTDLGFFCSLCTKEVVDLSNLSQYEISKFISENRNQSICARMKTSQLDMEFDLLEQTKTNRSFKYAAVAASVLAVSSLQAQETKQTKQDTTVVVKHSIAITGMIQAKNTTAYILQEVKINGILIDSITNLPLKTSKYGTLMISFDEKNTFRIRKDGTFKGKMWINSTLTDENISFSLNNENYYYEGNFIYTSKDNTKTVNIIIDPKKILPIVMVGMIKSSEE